MIHLSGSWRSGIEDAWADLSDFLPRLLLAVGVFVVGWILAIVFKKIVDLLMERSASQRDRGGPVATVAVRARRAVPRLVHLAIMLVTLWTAIEVVDPGSGESPAADFVDAMRGLFLVLGLAGLLTACAVVVVGVGGGLVRPMEERWEAWLQRMEPGQAEAAEGEQTPDAPRTARMPAVDENHRPSPTDEQTSGVQTSDVQTSDEHTADEHTARAPDETQVLPASTTGEPRRG